MAENTNNLEQVKKQLKGEIDTLEERYSSLNKEIESLESSKNLIKDSMKTVHAEFEEINKNIEGILKRLDKLTEALENSTGLEVEDNSKHGISFKNIVKNPLRKLAVGTMSAFYAAADKTAAGASSIKEGLDDIVAEAQCQNKKRRLRTSEQS